MIPAAAGLGDARARGLRVDPQESEGSELWEKKRARKFPRNFRGAQISPGGAKVEPGPARSAQVRRGPREEKFQKIPKNSKKTRNFGKNPKNGQKTAKKRPFPTVPVQLKSRNFKIFGKKAISGHHLGVFEILARRGVSSLFRFMRNDPRPYRTNKRLSEFNSGL